MAMAWKLTMRRRRRCGVAVLLMALIAPSAAVAAPGGLDLNFGGNGRVTTGFKAGPSSASAVAIQPDGMIVAVGSVESRRPLGSRFAVVRYRRSGRLDRTFADDGRATIKFRRFSFALAIALQGDGKIVLAGRVNVSDDGFFALARMRPNGTLDPRFGGDGKVTTDFGDRSAFALAVAIQADGKIVAAGTSFRCGGDDAVFALARYRRSGRLDRTFGNDGKVTTEIGSPCEEDTHISALAIQPDGKIVVAGSGHPDGAGSGSTFVVARYDSEGALDPTFGENGVVTTAFSDESAAHDVALQTDGGIVAGGWSSIPGSFIPGRFSLARYDTGGSLDPSFGGDGMVNTRFPGGRAIANAVALHADGAIVAAGGTSGSFALARYSKDGQLDSTFGADGMVTTRFAAGGSTAEDVAIAQNQKIVAAGSAGRKFALARYTP
jgi:uncharacterized delta-60 repeat protein